MSFTSVLIPSDPNEGFSNLLTLIIEFLLLSKGSLLVDLVVWEYTSISAIFNRKIRPQHKKKFNTLLNKL